MCPTTFLAPTLTAKTCLSALSHKMHFFWPSLRCKVIEQMVKSRYLVEFPAQKKEPKWFQNLGRFKKNSSCSVAKKSPKNWTGPCLSLNMVRRKRFIKWQTPSRNAKSSFQGANPTPPSPMQQWRPPARTTIVSRTVAAAANPAPIDASDMSFDEYADDPFDVFTHHRMKAENPSGSIRLRRALQGRPTSHQARF